MSPIPKQRSFLSPTAIKEATTPGDGEASGPSSDQPMYTLLPSWVALLPKCGDRPFRFQNDTQNDTILKRRLMSLLLLVCSSKVVCARYTRALPFPAGAGLPNLQMDFMDAANTGRQRLLECRIIARKRRGQQMDRMSSLRSSLIRCAMLRRSRMHSGDRRHAHLSMWRSSQGDVPLPLR